MAVKPRILTTRPSDVVCTIVESGLPSRQRLLHVSRSSSEFPWLGRDAIAQRRVDGCRWRLLNVQVATSHKTN